MAKIELNSEQVKVYECDICDKRMGWKITCASSTKGGRFESNWRKKTMMYTETPIEDCNFRKMVIKSDLEE